jgi:hypothetical protein
VTGNFTQWDRWDLVLGHHRAATTGGVTHEGAHPHNDGNIYIVHNGTLVTGWQQNSLHVVGNTDSQLIAKVLNEEGTEGLTKLTGPMALVWYDAKDQTINFYRNAGRTLFFMNTTHARLFASEMGMLKWLADRNEVDYTEVGALKQDCLVTIDKDKNVTAKELVVPLEKKSTWTDSNYGNTKTWSGPVGNTGNTNRWPDVRPTLTEVYSAFKSKTGSHIKSAKAFISRNYKKGETVEFYLNFTLTDNGRRWGIGWACGRHVSRMVAVDITNAPGNLDFSRMSQRFEAKLKELFEFHKGKETMLILTGIQAGGYKPLVIAGTLDTKLQEATEPKEEPKNVKGPDGKWISLSNFKKLTEDGCAYCGANLSVTQSNDIEWVQNSPLCPVCITQNPIFNLASH